MKPTPPMPLIHGSTAPIAMPVATAASMALPPLRNIPAPTSAALQFWATTTPLPCTAGLLIFCCPVSDSLINASLCDCELTVAGPDFATNPDKLLCGRAQYGNAGVTELNQIDLRALAAGSKRTWDAFVVAATPLINAVVRRALATYRLSAADVMEAGQDVFLRLWAHAVGLLKTYGSARAGLPTW